MGKNVSQENKMQGYRRVRKNFQFFNLKSPLESVYLFTLITHIIIHLYLLNFVDFKKVGISTQVFGIYEVAMCVDDDSCVFYFIHEAAGEIC